MATTYVGLYQSAARELVMEAVRETGDIPSEFREKVRGFAANLPGTCKLIGSWPGDFAGAPGVMVVEAESWDDLQHINNHYGGWITFAWRPTPPGGMSRD